MNGHSNVNFKLVTNTIAVELADSDSIKLSFGPIDDTMI